MIMLSQTSIPYLIGYSSVSLWIFTGKDVCQQTGIVEWKQWPKVGSNQQSLDERPFAFPTELVREIYIEWDFTFIKSSVHQF